MQKDKFQARAAHHSSGGRKIPVSAADRAAARGDASHEGDIRHEVMRTRADAAAAKEKRRSH